MNLIHIPNLASSSRWHLIVICVLTALFPVTALSQSNSGSASLRGTAKINDQFVIRGVMVVLTPQSSGSPGKPRPAWVGGDGEYRIEDLSPGIYTLTAQGKPIKTKVVAGVKIAEGNSNVQNLTLEKKDQTVSLHSKVLNPEGEPLKNAKIALYSAALPPSVCETCVLAEVRSNDTGEGEGLDVGRDENYTLTVSIYDEANKRELKLTASNIISIGTESEPRVELQFSGGPQPALTAKLLRDIQPKRIPMDLRPAEIAGVPTSSDTTNPAGSRTVANGAKMKLKGVVTRRDAETFTLRDMNGIDTVVRLDEQTEVKVKGGLLRGGSNYGQTSILRGLNLEVEGRGNSSGELSANKIRFNKFDLRVARAVESRAAPLEERASDTENKLSQVEANAQRLSGQMEELRAVSNAARGGAKAAQATADAAVRGVTATNERISALDDYAPETAISVLFRIGSAVLSPEAKSALDELASKAFNTKGYVLEISGFADSVGSIEQNRTLSQRRADAVIRYLVENHNIPLRRIVTPYGYGESNPVAENTSREGRSRNRRVEIKLLVNKGLTAPAPTMRP